MAAGLPIEGTKASSPRAGSVARADVPTCSLDERLGDVRARIGDWNACVVVNDARVVLGLLRQKELDADPDKSIEEVMRPAPSTFRPYVPIGEMAEYMNEHDVESSPITTSDGKLVGLLLRDDAIEALRRS